MPGGTRFAVYRTHWTQDDQFLRRSPRADRVADFPTLLAAAADRGRREADARAAAGNPFRHGGPSLFYQTSLPGPVLYDWVLDRGIDPPAAGPDAPHAAWVEWWDGFGHHLTPDQQAGVWEALDKLRFFDVREVSSAKLYVVVEINWTWNDQPYLDADSEGGTAVAAYRDRTKAEARCAALNAERRGERDHQGYTYFSNEGRDAEWSVLPITEATFFEVVEIDQGASP